jgi:hypothetical protein
MCKDFFKPTWGKVIGFIAVNCISLIFYMLTSPSVIVLGDKLGAFFTYFYLLLAPFGLLFKALAMALGNSNIQLNTAAIMILSIIQNVLEFAWQYTLACFFAAGFCKILNRKSHIIKPTSKLRK